MATSSMSCIQHIEQLVATIQARRQHHFQHDDEHRARERDELRKQYEGLIYESTSPISDKIMSLRKMVLKYGIPPETEDEMNSVHLKCSLRAIIWKILLGAVFMNADQYINFVKAGPTLDDNKIRDDTFRTFQTSKEFWSRVDESKLARILNAISRLYSKPAIPEENIPAVGIYVQGMNVLLGPIVYSMPELDAFTAFRSLITKHCPRYVLKNLDGVHHGCSLVDRCLEYLDPELHKHIKSKIASVQIFAFKFVFTLLGNMSPLNEVIKVWDAIFAFGIHFNVLLICTHIMLLRDKLLSEEKAVKIQSEIMQVPLDGEMLVECALALVNYIPESIFDELISHPIEKITDVTKVLGSDFASEKSTNDSISSVGKQRSARPQSANSQSKSNATVSKLLIKKDGTFDKTANKSQQIRRAPSPVSTSSRTNSSSTYVRSRSSSKKFTVSSVIGEATELEIDVLSQRNSLKKRAGSASRLQNKASTTTWK